jgi:molybdopterin-containing oxidoreductase family membrane subunit
VVLLKRLFWLLGFALFALGLIGWYQRLAFGHAGANYGSIVTWGLWVAAYIYFIGLSAGSFLISSLVYVFDMKRFESVGRLALFTAVVTLLLALLSIWVDLGHMDRAWHVMVYPNFKSPMAWMIWLYMTYFLLLLAETWLVLRRDLVRGAAAPGWKGAAYRLLKLGSRDASDRSARRDRRAVRVLAVIGVPLAIMFHGGVGALFGTVAARPHWHSGLFPILFVLSALVSGGALLTLAAGIFQDGWNRNRDTVTALGRLVLAMLVLDVVFQVSEYLVAFRGGIPGHVEGMKIVLAGPYWWVFWVWQVGIGTLIPILLLALPTRRSPDWVAVAALLVTVGFFGLRLNIVIPGLAAEELAGLSEAIASPRLAAGYLPSASEWLLTAGVVGFGLILFGFGEMLLPHDRQEAGHVRA